MKEVTQTSTVEKSNNSSTSETLHFDVDSHLLLELGERLVSKPSVALAELVKNSYDADAPSVTIEFLNIGKKGGTIIVEDTGEGMNFHDLQTKWMRIGTDEKERNPVSSKYKRSRTGRKGIGRFACRLLSKKLILESVSEKGTVKEKITAFFLWDNIEPGKKVEDFAVRVTREPVSRSHPTFTRLVLENTREPWEKEDVERFQGEILGLVNPFPWESGEISVSGSAAHDPGLNIIIKAPEYPELKGLVSEDILNSSWGKLEGKINKDGIPSYTLTITSTSESFDFSLDGKEYIDLGKASFTIYFFTYGKMEKTVPGINLTKLREIGREQGGVKVFLDGFRVFRYGEPGDDWLHLEFDRSRSYGTTREVLLGEAKGLKRPMLSLPGNNQLFGAVFVSRTNNPNISPTVTRDRLLENTAFDQLRKFVRLGIDWLTIKYAAYKAKEKKKTKSSPKEDVLTTINALENLIDKSSAELGADTAFQLQEYVSKAKEEIVTQREETISQISMLRVLSSTGTMIQIFNHEISLAIRRLSEMAADFQKFLGFLPSEHQNPYRILLAKLRAWEFSVKNQAKLIGLMLGKDTRTQKSELSIRKAVDKIFEPFNRFMTENHIEPLNEVQSFSRTPPMYEAELHAILVNLLTNSIKAQSEDRDMKICVRVEETKDFVSILFLDTGTGLARERWEEVFEPFVSYSFPNLDFGVGTGLGLTIVNDIVEAYRGNVSFVDPPDGWSTCVKIAFPKVKK